jgi:signal recognition particle receptor subunit beta
MRIGEIVIIGASPASESQFIKTICHKIEQKNQAVSLGELKISEELLLYLYGVSAVKPVNKAAWPLLSTKILGYIIIFDWYQPQAVPTVRKTLDFLNQNYPAPIVLAGNLNGTQADVKGKLLAQHISFSNDEKLCFCRNTDERSCNDALITLLDVLIGKL